MIYFTGDIHSNVDDLIHRFDGVSLTKDDIIVILGDVCVNYFQSGKDTKQKAKLRQSIPATIFCVRGNHEIRPENLKSYRLNEVYGGMVYVEDDFPNILFAIDGWRYYFNEYDVCMLVIGGAYSVDKQYRLITGNRWFADEQLSLTEMAEIKSKCVHNPNVDIVLTHTCPYQWRPTHLFLPNIDQSCVDNTMEYFLTDIEIVLSYKHWLFGHYHGDEKINDKALMMYKDVVNIEDLLNK